MFSSEIQNDNIFITNIFTYILKEYKCEFFCFSGFLSIYINQSIMYKMWSLLFFPTLCLFIVYDINSFTIIQYEFYRRFVYLRVSIHIYIMYISMFNVIDYIIFRCRYYINNYSITFLLYKITFLFCNWGEMNDLF